MGVLLIFYALVEMFELELCSKCLRRHVQKFMHIYIRVLSYGLKSLLVDEIWMRRHYMDVLKEMNTDACDQCLFNGVLG